jgi:hypothetical protein
VVRSYHNYGFEGFIKYLLLVIPLFIAGCFVPRTQYSPIDKGRYLPNRVNEVVVLPDSTFEVMVWLPVFSYENGNKYIVFQIEMIPSESAQFHINDANIEALDENGHVLPNDGSLGIKTQQGIYYVQSFKELTDSQIYKPGSGYWITIGAGVDYRLVKRCKSISIHYYAAIMLNGKEIILEDTIKVRKRTHFELVLGD